MRESRVWRIGAILVPCLPVVEQRRLSPPVAPRHPVVAVPEQRPFPDTLQEDAEVKPLPRGVQIHPVRISRCGIPQIDNIPVLTGGITVQADLSVAVHILVSRIANPDVVGHAYQLVIGS